MPVFNVPVFKGDVGGIKGKNEEVKTLVSEVKNKIMTHQWTLLTVAAARGRCCNAEVMS
jgi:hypothetical protein